MNTNEIKQPSNISFGFFLTGVFLVASFIAWFLKSISLCLIFFAFASIVLLITITKPQILQALNNGWMRLGLFLGMIISPIVLGAIYFLIITPVGLGLRLFGRDELRLTPQRNETFWIEKPDDDLSKCNFYNQF